MLQQGDGSYEVIPDFEIDDWLRAKIQASEEELLKERDCVGHLVSASSQISMKNPFISGCKD